jgi:hypothetical protein
MKKKETTSRYPSTSCFECQFGHGKISGLVPAQQRTEKQKETTAHGVRYAKLAAEWLRLRNPATGIGEPESQAIWIIDSYLIHVFVLSVVRLPLKNKLVKFSSTNKNK